MEIIDAVLNPFKLDDKTALELCLTSRSICQGIPLPQSKAVLGTLQILSVGFNDIYDHVDRGSVLPGGGSNGLTVSPEYLKNLSQFYINVGEAVFDRMDLGPEKTFANLSDSESLHLHTQCGYTIARSVSQMNPDGTVRNPFEDI